jgi:PAP2 superfamily
MPGTSLGIHTADLRSDPDGQLILEWNAVLEGVLAGQSPFAASRFAAIMHLAVFEAVNAITEKYEPYLTVPCPAGSRGPAHRCPLVTAPDGASPQAAAVAAAHDVLVHYLPAAVATVDAAAAASLAAVPDSPAKSDGLAVGAAAAAALIALRATDGASAPPQFYLPASAEPGDWQLTPACPAAGGILVQWQNVTPFGVRSSRQFRARRPPPLASRSYARDFEEVMTVGSINSTARPQDRADVATLYAVHLAGPVWNQVARQVSAAQGTGLSANARAFALLNMAGADALIAVMATKYHHTFWRPETAIREAASDGNPATSPDPTFAPFINTPCHPSYPSAHATASYAARTIIELIWGNDDHSIVMEHPALPQISLRYTRLDQITTDIDDARVYGGIHFRFDQVAGARQGDRIGEYVFRKHLRSRRGR